jgi:Kef-type K+ transport system membrane component KefB
LAAAGGAQDALVALFVVLLAVKLGEEGCRRVGQPPIIGEILAGVLVGPSVLGVVEPDAVLEVFAELGVVFPLFVVGVETRLADMRAVGGRALRVGVLGVFVPFLGGFALVRRSATTWRPPLLLGAALMATSAGITSAVLLDLGAGDRDATRTILGAAVIDDVLALVLLSVVVGSPAIARITSVGVLLIGSVVFIGVVAVGGSRLLARYPRALKAPDVHPRPDCFPRFCSASVSRPSPRRSASRRSSARSWPGWSPPRPRSTCN